MSTKSDRRAERKSAEHHTHTHTHTHEEDEPEANIHPHISSDAVSITKKKLLFAWDANSPDAKLIGLYDTDEEALTKIPEDAHSAGTVTVRVQMLK